MKKFILSAFVILSFGTYVVWQNMGGTSGSNVVQSPITVSKNKTSNKVVLNTIPTAESTPTPIPTPTPIQTPTPSPVVVPLKKSGIYNDGQYTGDPAFAYNENVQVKAIISGGRLTDIQFLQYPNSGRSARISSFALPVLKQEAIQAQSANVNAVSGASYTSPAFIQSLSSALAQAKA